MNLLYSINTKMEFFRSREVETGEEFKRLSTETIQANPYLPFHSKKIFRFSCIITDFVAINTVNCVLAYLMQSSAFYNQLFFLLTNVFWIVSSYLNALYFGPSRFYPRSFYSFILYFLSLISFMFLFGHSYPREYVFFHLLGVSIALMSTRLVIHVKNEYLHKRILCRRIIIIGYSNLSRQLRTNLEFDGKHVVLGYFDDFPGSSNPPNVLLGSVRESLSFAIKAGINEIYCVLSPEKHPDLYALAHKADQNFIRFNFLPDLDHFLERKFHLDFSGKIPIVSPYSDPLKDIDNRFRKRMVDIFFSFIVIVCILSWLVPLLAIIIKLDSKGPVFFKQLRSGKNNKPFVCLKFRSLKVNDLADKVQVRRDDNRFTSVGKFLRRTNLDEFPQFFNVLQGHMSVVGPRPHMLEHTATFSQAIPEYMVRHFVKPGVTGWAQVNGYRGEIKVEQQLKKRVEYDIAYLGNWSMWFDVRIILLTIFKMFSGDKNAF